MKSPFVKGLHSLHAAHQPVGVDAQAHQSLPWDLARYAHVYFNGQRLDPDICLEAHVVGGFVVVYERDSRGLLILDWERELLSHVPRTKMMFGKVQVVDPREHPLDEVYLR